MHHDWDAWDTESPYAVIEDDAVIEVWRPWQENTPIGRIRLRDVPGNIDTTGLWWRLVDA